MNKTPQHELLFKKENYKFLLIGIAIITIGFILMSGGGSDDPNVFSEDIFNFRRIRLAPTVVLIGFGLIFYSIFKKSKK
jgi:Protein of unknown function (DUF3098)